MAKRVGILTSGGDAPGMNAAVRTLVRTALHLNWQPYAIYRGYHGMIRGEIEPLSSRSVSGIIQRGGTILKSARSESFRTEEGQAKAVASLRKHEIDAVVVIGGDGSFRGALDLEKLGIAVIGVPGTIDNDIPCTDHSIGFDTAVNTVMDAINKIRDTASSQERIYIIEVMGRHCGFIALYSGLAGGADSILIPEVPPDLEQVCEKIETAHDKGKTHNIIVAAEGVGLKQSEESAGDMSSVRIAKYIEEKTGYETRITILGHIQRGGAPTVRDRLLASRLAYHAMELVAHGSSGKMVGEVNRSVRSWDLDYALQQKNQLDLDYYRLFEILSSM